MLIEFCGTAGYHPSTARHTSCLYLPQAAPDSAILLDAGTGLFRLIGRSLPAQLHILLTHAHLDHVAGLTFLLDLVGDAGPGITLYGAPEALEGVTQHLFNSPLFPAAWPYGLQVIEPGSTVTIAGVTVRTLGLNHPGGSVAYRLEWPETSLGYVTDTPADGSYEALVNGVSLLVHECTYADSQVPLARRSRHCTTSDVVQMARRVQAGRLVLTHFDPLVEEDPLQRDCLGRQVPAALAAFDGLQLEF